MAEDNCASSCLTASKSVNIEFLHSTGHGRHGR